MVTKSTVRKYNTRTARVYVAVYVSLVVGSVVFATLFSQTKPNLETIVAKAMVRVGFYVAILVGLHRVWTRFVTGATANRND